jgi:hypothetical protein
VIFDCNVWLDVARVVGEPFSWDAFDREVARLARDPLPHPDSMKDSLRAIAVCTSGRLAGSERIEVWTSDHIVDTVEYKAVQSLTPDAEGFCGLGWNGEASSDLVEGLIGSLVDTTGGGWIGSVGTDGHPPLDHEDGRVLKACREVVNDDPLARVYCVTNDGGFLRAYAEGRLGNHTVVLSPARFVQLVRTARHTLSLRGMLSS